MTNYSDNSESERRKIFVYDVCDTDVNGGWKSKNTIILNQAAVGIGVLSKRYLYIGDYYEDSANPPNCYYNSNLVSYDLYMGDKSVVDVGSPVLGVAVDQENGNVYVTTKSGQIKVYTGSLSLLNSYDTNAIPTGICILNDIDSNKSEILNVDINDATDNPVLPGQALQYTVRCSLPAGKPNATNLSVYCNLPREVKLNGFVEPNGAYDSLRHRIEWVGLGTLIANGSIKHRFNVVVNQRAKPNNAFYAFAGADSDNYYSDIAAHKTDVGYWRGGTTRQFCMSITIRTATIMALHGKMLTKTSVMRYYWRNSRNLNQILQKGSTGYMLPPVLL